MKNFIKERIVFLALLLLMTANNIQAKIIINEIMASNASINVDPVDSAYSDWVELYNDDSLSVSLQGYYMTDDFKDISKWQFPDTATIPAKCYILVWCDGNNSGLHTNFKLSADGEQIGIYSPKKEPLDSFSFGVQFVDVSYGRPADDISALRFFLNPTPSSANSTQAYTGYANQPEILTLGGFYNGPLQVEITEDLGGKVYYTLDGSEPTTSSNVYSGPIDITATTVLRARIIEDGLMPGKIVTETYFLNEGFEKHNLPVISISTTPANFWDSKTGIYTQSFKPEWEVPVNIELFENNGSDRAAVNELAGIKINGLYSWQLPQKMLGVYFKKKYGESSLSYQLFFDHKRSSFDNFALRASGNDWSNTLFRDGMLHQACRIGNENLDLMAFRPSIVYVNGKFLGIHNIREKVDDDYVSKNYGLKKGTFDMIEGGDNVETGDMTEWDSLATITSKDLSVQSNFDALANCFDVENFTDYIIAELYSKNTSLSHNTMAWKPKGSGKWRWILMDADRGFFGFGGFMLSDYMEISVWPLAKMMKNSSYKTYLCQRIANQLFTTFNPITMRAQIDEHQKDIEAMIPAHVARWLGTTSSYGNAMPSVEYWYDEVEELRTFASGRPKILMENLTSYGCSSPAFLSLSSTPSNACTWLFNNMKANKSTWYGCYPQNMPITLKAIKKDGYNFVGWRENKFTEIIPKESTWSYLDKGTNQGTSWKETSFDDSGWSNGAAPLGYTISSVKTKVSYGTNSSSKYITTYFRKHFTVNTPLTDMMSLKVNLLCDDGAVIYLNGKKVLTTNMPVSDVNYKTLALYACGGLAQTSYVTFDIPVSYLQEGENTFAAEVHQAAASSTDLIFDLQLVSEESGDANTYFSTNDTCNFTLQGDRSITAVYEANGQSIVPDSINNDLIFYKAKSPYIVSDNVYIKEGVKLTIEPGVEVLMAPKTSFYVHGSINAQGLPTDSITFRLNPIYSSDNSWGALCFIHATDTTRMSYMELHDASNGPKAYNCVAAISAFDAVMRLDHLKLQDIDSNPISARYSDIKVTNSDIHSNVIGDLINVKYGKGEIVNCRFRGNYNPDTDGIDFDGVSNGIIKKVIITDFEGSNSDAIDLGERTKGVRIDSVMIFNITDKGVSVGQRSSALLSNSTIVQTNLGVGVKDSSDISVDRCTFYGVGTPIACYEKVLGRAGGNAIVKRSILSNSYDETVLCDNKSTVNITNTLSDNDTLPANCGNIYGDPGFTAASHFDLSLKQPFTPAIGSYYQPLKPAPDIELAEIYYYNTAPDRTEYIRLYNPGDENLDISSYTISKAIEFTFPEGSIVAPHGSVYVAKNKELLTLNGTPAYNWTKGNLANEGEDICISDARGTVVDQVSYLPSSPWPSISNETNTMAIELSDYNIDNHFAKYWQTKSYPTLVESITDNQRHITYNTELGTATAHFSDHEPHIMDVYSTTGQKILSTKVIDGQTINLATLGQHVLMISVCGKVEKVIISNIQ